MSKTPSRVTGKAGGSVWADVVNPAALAPASRRLAGLDLAFAPVADAAGGAGVMIADGATLIAILVGLDETLCA